MNARRCAGCGIPWADHSEEEAWECMDAARTATGEDAAANLYLRLTANGSPPWADVDGPTHSRLLG